MEGLSQNLEVRELNLHKFEVYCLSMKIQALRTPMTGRKVEHQFTPASTPNVVKKNSTEVT